MKLAFLVLTGVIWAQAPVVPPSQAMCNRALQLMDAGGVAVPGLARSGAPILENVKQACLQIRVNPAASQPAYEFLMNLRAYIALYEALPKPDPFPATARAQFSELRDLNGNFDTYFRGLLDQKEKQILSSDRDDIARFAEANRKLGAAQPGKPRIVFFGDSITQGWRLNEYFPERDFVNRGISGQIAGQLLGRMKADVIDLHPEAVVLLIGTNDIARGVPIDRIEGQIEMLAQLASANKIKPILCSLLPVSDYHKAENPAYEQTLSRPLGTILALNSWMERYAAQHGYGYANFHAAVVDGKGYLGEESSDDGLHPNGKGYRLMAPVVLAAIEKVVTVPPPATPAKPTGKAVSSKK